MERYAERTCHMLIGLSLLTMSVGIGYELVFGTKLADFVVIVTGLFLGWVAFIYCLGNAMFWR